MNQNNVEQLLDDLIQLSAESEIVEFKEAKESFSIDKLGQYFSALSNEANLLGVDKAWLVFGISNEIPRKFVGTSFRKSTHKLDELKKEIGDGTISRHTFRAIYEVSRSNSRILMFEIPPAPVGIPIPWKGHYYGRDGESLVALSLEKIERIRRQALSMQFEKLEASQVLDGYDILNIMNYTKFFSDIGLNRPVNDLAILESLRKEKMIIKKLNNRYSITNLGAILYANDISMFEGLVRKAIRVIKYQGTNKIKTIREQIGVYGYAIGFEGLIDYISNLLPQNEVIEEAVRREVKMYPEIAIRELVANAIIHQDFFQRGTSPMVEIFSDRIEFTNNGLPLIDVMRFIDEPPQSRNEILAAYMRRIGICEERGSGIDKVIASVEEYQLPPPKFEVKENHTRITLFAYRPLNDMTNEEKIRACYQHSCLLHESGQRMSNQSLRNRFNIPDNNYSIASRIIKDTLEKGLIKPFEEGQSNRFATYIPNWA